MEWRATGGEFGALLVEAQWIAALRPAFNRVPRTTKRDPQSAPWPFEGAVLIEECDAAGGPSVLHLIDRWCYLGAAASIVEATALARAASEPPFELSTWRILQGRLERGLRVQPLGTSGANEIASVA